MEPIPDKKPDKKTAPLFDYAVKEGYLTKEKADELAEKAQRENLSAEDTVMDNKALPPEELDSLITIMKSHSQPVDEVTEFKVEEMMFGDLAVMAGYATREQLLQALNYQKQYTAQGIHYRLGDILIEMNILTAEQLRELLADQNKIIFKCPECNIQFNVFKKALEFGVKCTRCGLAMVEPEDLDSVSVLATIAGGPISGGGVTPPQKEQKTEQLGHWRILGKLGEGGMGIVYKGEHIQDGRVAAIKVIPQHLATIPKSRLAFSGKPNRGQSWIIPISLKFTTTERPMANPFWLWKSSMAETYWI